MRVTCNRRNAGSEIVADHTWPTVHHSSAPDHIKRKMIMYWRAFITDGGTQQPINKQANDADEDKFQRQFQNTNFG